MSLSPLEVLVKETRNAFIVAKVDGVLDVSEIIQIAVGLAQKMQKLTDLPGSDKKALLLLTLKRGLDASGGVDNLPGFSNASAEEKAKFQEQLLAGASVTVDLMLSAASGKLNLRKPSSWKACVPVCLSVVKTLLPKDQALVNEALKYSETVLNKVTEPTETVVVEKVAEKVVEKVDVEKLEVTLNVPDKSD